MQPPFPAPPEDPVDADELAAIESRLEADLAAESGWRSRVRALPTPVRRGILSALLLSLIGMGFLGSGKFWVAIVLGAVGLGLGWMSLRPIQQPALPRWVEVGALTITLLVLGAIVITGAGEPVSLRRSLSCFAPGIGVGLAVLGGWWLLSRGSLGFYGIAAATCGGMTANAFLAARCGSTNPEHLVTGHVSVLFVLVLVVSLTQNLRRFSN